MVKIGIVRGLMPRLTQAEFASSFHKFDPIFITGESSSEIKNFCQQVKLEHRDLPIKPLWGIDLVRLVLGQRTHQSWVGPDGLLNACRDLDVLETYELYHLFSGQAADVAKKLAIPLVCEVWTSFSGHLGYRIPPYALVARKVIQQASLFVARNNRAARALTQLGVPKNKLKVIYHGVNLGRFYPARKKRKDNEWRVLFVGSLEPYKGIDMLLDIWPKISKEVPKAKLWLVGKGSLLPRAQKTDGVRVFGYVRHIKLPEIYRSVDVFVFPSQNRYLGPFLWGEEFFSYALMEAQASGLPVVATRCGGIPEMVGESNLLVEQSDVEGLYQALKRLIADRGLRIKIGQSNRKKAKNIFDLRKQIKQIETAIKTIL